MAAWPYLLCAGRSLMERALHCIHLLATAPSYAHVQQCFSMSNAFARCVLAFALIFVVFFILCVSQCSRCWLCALLQNLQPSALLCRV